MSVLIEVSTSSFILAAQAPLILQSCVLAPPPPPVDVIPQESIVTPVPPGFEYESLPEIDVQTQIIDDSPDQIIGCANELEFGKEQEVLRALFPEAVAGDGVVSRQSNDIWVYDGTSWVNVGPTPGPRLVFISVLPGWNERVVLEATTRSVLEVESLVGPLRRQSNVLLATKSVLEVLPVKAIRVASVGLQISAIVPQVNLVPVTIRRGKVVELVRYTGNGTTQDLDAPWPVGMAIIGSVFSATQPNLYDIVRGDDRRWQILNNTLEITTPNSLAFKDQEEFVTLGPNNFSNVLNRQYYAWLFRAPRPPVVNNDGSIQSLVRESQVYNLIEYTGTGVAGETVGHGLGAVPDFVFVIRVDGSNSTFGAGGRSVGGDFWNIPFSFNSSRTFSNFSQFRRLTSSTVEIASSFDSNGAGVTHILYAFKEVQGLSKIGFYSGNGLGSGTFIDCGFDVGFLMVRRRNAFHPWMVFTENMPEPGRRYQRTDLAAESVASSQFYSFESRGFRVKNETPNNTGGIITQLNELDGEYIYMAFASGFYLKRECPSVSLGLTLNPVSVSSGVSVPVGSVAQGLLALNPPYAGIRASVNAVPRTRLQIAATAPDIRSGVTVSPKEVKVFLKRQPVAYVGEATSEVLTTLDIISGQDQEPLEESAKGSVLRLVKRLKDAGLWDKIETLNLLCVARTRLGALVPLKGRVPTISGLGTSMDNFDYSRRTGLKPNQTFNVTIRTGVVSGELAATDNHLAAYVQDLNASPFTGGDLIGDGFTTNSIAIGRRTAISGFEFRNRNNTTSQSGIPHWSGPSLAATSRSNSSDYQVRVAGSTRTISQAIVDQSSPSTRNIDLFQFWNGPGNFRVPMYSFGQALDLGALDDEITLFLQDLRERGIPDKKIEVPGVDISLVGVPPRRQFRALVSTLDLQVSASAPAIETGASVQVGVADIEVATVEPFYAGARIPIVIVSTSNVDLEAGIPSVSTGASAVIPKRNLVVSAIAPTVFVTALGGDTVNDVTIGGETYRVHTFSSTGASSIVFSTNASIEYLIVAGGGGGGMWRGGGGGAGGLLSNFGQTPLPVLAGTYTVTVGTGGNGAPGGSSLVEATAGANSSAFELVALGGGKGGNGANNANGGGNGGSGGGAGGAAESGAQPPGAGLLGQGNDGGNSVNIGTPVDTRRGGGGGGAGTAGGDAGGNAGNGGDGLEINFDGVLRYFAGGGGGGVNSIGSNGIGGLGGGGNGSSTSNAANGTDGLGGGGGGAGGGFQSSNAGGDGGSGVVLIRYRI